MDMYDEIADYLLEQEEMRNIVFDEKYMSDRSSLGLLGIYNPETGIYETHIDIAQLLYSKGFRDRFRATNKLKRALLEKAPLAMPNSNPDLSPVNNGVFNRTTKVLEPYSPDEVFLSKIWTDYSPNAENVSLKSPSGQEFDCEYLIDYLDEDVGYLRRILELAVFPNIECDKNIFLYGYQDVGAEVFSRLLRDMTQCNPLLHTLSMLRTYHRALLPEAIAIVSNNKFHLPKRENRTVFKYVFNREVMEHVPENAVENILGLKWNGLFVQGLTDNVFGECKEAGMLDNMKIVPMEKDFNNTDWHFLETVFNKDEKVHKYLLKTILEGQ